MQCSPISVLSVVAAVVRREDGRILLARRHLHSRNGGLWEFPGGKVEQGESPQEALARELMEELGIEVSVGAEVARVEHAYPHAAIELRAFACDLLRGTPAPLDCCQVAWVLPGEFRSYPMPEADLPVAEVVQRSWEFHR